MQLFPPGRRAPLLSPAIALVFCLSSALSAGAQTGALDADGIGVARISLIDGNVAVQRGDSSESLAAAINAPILGGDYVTTGRAARTEIQFDGSSQLRLGPDSQLRFTHLDTANRTVQLALGTLELRLLETDGSSEIDTPSISLRPQTRGAYRVTVSADGQTLVTVRSGRAQVDTPQGAQDVAPGSTLVAQGSADNPSVQSVAAVAADDFDRFNAERDRLHLRALADASFVNTDIGGVEDLATNGRWVNDGSYGRVWTPAAVGSDWAPYRDGRWVWEDGYGWTWVAAEPWGWAPYHYGSWYHSPDYGWCWYPPRPRIYAPWRPALVAFIGFGAGSGFSLGDGGRSFGNVGWVPLAPNEPYHPWWGNRYGYNGGPTTIINNVTNVTNINVYRNVRYNAVSGVTSQRFLQGNFSRNASVSATQLQQAHVFRTALPIVPTASNLRFARSTAAPVAQRPPLVQRSFAGHTDVVRRTSFGAQRVALATATHASVSPLRSTSAPRPAPRALPALNGAARWTGNGPPPMPPANGADPWARFNQRRALSSPPHQPPLPNAAAVSAPPIVRRLPARPNAPLRPPGAPNPYAAPPAANVYRAPGPEPVAAPHLLREPGAPNRAGSSIASPNVPRIPQTGLPAERRVQSAPEGQPAKPQPPRVPPVSHETEHASDNPHGGRPPGRERMTVPGGSAGRPGSPPRRL